MNKTYHKGYHMKTINYLDIKVI